jgi:uncharacterized membrane protein YfcA
MEWLGYIAAVFMGLSLGLIGGGGSVLTVPILVYLFSIQPVTATAYSLFVVGATAFVGGISYLKKGEVDLKTGALFGIPSFAGVYLTRAFVVPRLSDPVFSLGHFEISKGLLMMAAFSILMIGASYSMIRKPRAIGADESKKTLSSTQKWLLILAEGFLVGGVTGFVGAGGGFLIIPALVLLVGMPMKIAIGTSLFIIAAKSLIGFTGDLQNLNNVDWQLLITLSAIAISGLFIGVKFSKKVSEQQLKKGFGYFVLIMGIVILIDQIHKM